MAVVESSTVRARPDRARVGRLGRVLVSLAVVLLGSPAPAAVIRLTGGGLIEAQAWREVGDDLEVALEGGTLRVPKADVLRIDGPPPRPVAQPVPLPAARPIPTSALKVRPPAPSPTPAAPPVPVAVAKAAPSAPPPPGPVPAAMPPSPPIAAALRPAPGALAAPPLAVPPVPVAVAKLASAPSSPRPTPATVPPAAPIAAPPLTPRLPTEVAVDQWRRDLASPAVEVRRRAASALAQLAESDADTVVPLLTAALKDGDAQVRIAAALALGPHGREPRAVTAVLVSTLGATDVARRRTGSQVLVMMGPAARDAAPALLLAFASDPDATVRQNAALALRQIGPAAEEVVPGLTSALRHKDPEVRRAAAMLLGDLGGAAAAIQRGAPAPRP